MDNLSVLNGKTINSVKGLERGSAEVVFGFQDGTSVLFHHYQDCCEHVCLEEVDSPEPSELVGAVILDASERDAGPLNSNQDADREIRWTFYRIQTSKGLIFMRWCGTSNGYYAIGVDVDIDQKNQIRLPD